MAEMMPTFHQSYLVLRRPGGNGAMDSALACCAGGLGLIPAVGIVWSRSNIQMIFLPLLSKVLHF